ncbi:MAG: D-alanine--D-alanine ligase [Pseudomonadota bacterium]
MNEFGRIGLAVGGDSTEREISLRSGQAVAAALDQLALAYDWLDGAPAVLDAAMNGRIDRVLNVLHGRGGEDGRLQGAMAILGMPMTGSGVAGSAIAMDKLQTKRLWRVCGLPTPHWRVLRAGDAIESVLDDLAPPYFVKPAREGSSVGMSRVMSADGLQTAVERALEHDPTALVEQMVLGQEYTAAVLEQEPLPLIRIETPREFYDYDAKYESGDTHYHCPCGLELEHEQTLQALAVQAFDVLGCSGWGRVDFMLDGDQNPWLLEANTVPGLTNTSLVPMAAEQAGLSFPDLVERILLTSVPLQEGSP